MKPLTLKGILKKHKQNTKDKQSLSLRDKKLHQDIETKEVKKEEFNKLIQKATKQYLRNIPRSIKN